MNILDYLNVSNESNPESDSGFIFQKLLITEILNQRPDWNFFLVASKKIPPFDSRVQVLPFINNVDKYKVRFNFPWEALKANLEGIADKVDILYVNQAEQATNLKALMATLTRRRIPIVTYFHYLAIEPSSHKHFTFSRTEFENPPDIIYDHGLNDGGIGQTVFMRQLEALIASDYSVTCSHFGADLLIHTAQRIAPSVSKPIKIINPPVSIEEIANARSGEKFKRKTVLSNHRMYKHYGIDEFLELMNRYFRENGEQDFELLFTNPTSNRSKERKRLDPSVEEIINIIKSTKFARIKYSRRREEYYRTVSRCHLAVAPMRPSALWSMSAVDAMACGLPTLCPDYACFPEIVGSESPLLFSSFRGFKEILMLLLNDRGFYEEQSEYCRRRAEQFDVKHTAQKFIRIFEQAVY